MSGAPPGSVVSIYLDTPRGLDVGDEVRTTTTGRRYEVVTVRVQTRGKNVGRKHLKVRVLAPDHPTDPDVRVIPVTWYPRPKKAR